MQDDNVIRPAFGAARTAEPPKRTDDKRTEDSRTEDSRTEDPRTNPEPGRPPLRLLGTAARHRVGLIRDPAAQEGDVFRIVVGPEDAQAVETVALLPAAGGDAEGEAERIGFAILRALEVVEGAA